jgi:lipopolysaccharide/colanic/teichoic acid biosynthesis glycosyltransferase
VTWIILAVLAALLAYGIERGLCLAPLDDRWRYRLSFLLGASLGILLYFAYYFLLRQSIQSAALLQAFSAIDFLGLFLASLTACMLGAFLGGLLATSLKGGLWEDNAPPPESVQADVLEIHRRVIGLPQDGLWSKRSFDLLLALAGLLISAPVWFLSVFLVWIEDPGPVLFVKNSVGKGGVNFHQFKIRSMVREAELDTGPILAQEGDERVLWVGRFLRKTALDELPQLLNILRGDMSVVGPRPQRTILVDDYLQVMPEYAERHRVRPGLAGLAQVAGDYYLTPRQKLRFDRLYICHISLGFDLKLLFLAFLIAFWFRWRRDWNGKLPRRLLHEGDREW